MKLLEEEVTDRENLCILSQLAVFRLLNRIFERLVGPLDEIVTFSVHKNNVIMLRHIVM